MEVALGIVVTILVGILYLLLAHIQSDIALRERIAERLTRIEARLKTHGRKDIHTDS